MYLENLLAIAFEHSAEKELVERIMYLKTRVGPKSTIRIHLNENFKIRDIEDVEKVVHVLEDSFDAVENGDVTAMK